MRWAVFAAAALLACGKTGNVRKSDGPPPKPIEWLTDVNVAAKLAAETHKRGLVFVGAQWDTAAKELEYQTFVDPDVRRLVTSNYIPLSIDVTDDENPVTNKLKERFAIIGEPALILLEPDFKSEIFRANEFVPPQQFASMLLYAGTEAVPEPRAVAVYDRNRALLDDIRQKVLNHPFLSPTRFPQLPDCWSQPSPAKETCAATEEAQRNKQIAEHDQFEREILPKLLAGTPILTLHVERYSEPLHFAYYAHIGQYAPEQKTGTRNLRVGATLDDETKLGWGEYATSYKAADGTMVGDHELHRGIEVSWHQGTDAVSFVVLADGFRRPRDWN